MKKDNYWCVITKRGAALTYSLSDTRGDSIYKFLENARFIAEWDLWEIKYGYRCVKIEIVEVKT